MNSIIEAAEYVLYDNPNGPNLVPKYVFCQIIEIKMLKAHLFFDIMS